MNKDGKILVVAAFLLCGIVSAIGGAGTIGVTVGSGKLYDVVTDGSGNYIGIMAIGDGTAAANYAAVKASTTAAGASDPSLVTNESPNSQLSVTVGTTADTAYAGSGNSTLSASLRGIYNALTAPIVAGTNTIGGFFGVLQTSNGWNQKLLNGLAGTVTAVKSSAAGQVSVLYCYNGSGALAYLQVFDAATAGSVTLGSTAPSSSWAVPNTQAAGFAVSLVGVQFTNGIQVASTTTATGATGASMDCNAIYH